MKFETEETRVPAEEPVSRSCICNSNGLLAKIHLLICFERRNAVRNAYEKMSTLRQLCEVNPAISSFQNLLAVSHQTNSKSTIFRAFTLLTKVCNPSGDHLPIKFQSPLTTES